MVRFRDDGSTKWAIPILSTFDFAKFIPAPEIYQKIVAFIGWTNDNPEIPNKQTDTEKIKSNGFDTKISFRHRKNMLHKLKEAFKRK